MQGSEIKNNASHNTLFYNLHPLIVALRNKKREMPLVYNAELPFSLLTVQG